MSHWQKSVIFVIGLGLFLSYGCNQQVNQEAQVKKGVQKDKHTTVSPESPKATTGSGQAVRVRHAGMDFDTYTIDYPKEKIRLYWKDNRGNKLKSIDSLKTHVERQGQQLVFATNAGMYMEDFSPLGLYKEDGKVLRQLNRVKRAYGNFYLQPNGVFVLTKDRAMVVTTEAYAGIKEKVLFATQSGPMLVINGKLHPSFTKGSQNLNIRSGVGIDSTGKVVLAITNKPGNYYDFATLFQEVFGCRQALFLDGAICRMYLPALDRYELGGEFGAMIGVTTAR
jgi:uncharacterized protein YigE (DUF2233 family)